MNKELRVLVVEDSPQDMVLINHELRRAGFRFRARRVESRDAFLHELEYHPPDIILSDHGVPGFDGFAALAEARNRCPEAPFIFVTGAPREDVVRQTLHSGADDYVLKSHLNLLGPAVERALREATARAARSSLEIALQNAEEYLHVLSRELSEHASFMLDGEGCVASWNPGAERMLGYEPNEILGRPLANLLAPNAGLPQELLEAAGRDGRAESPASLVHKSDGSMQVHAKMIALRGQAGRLRGFLCVLQHGGGHPVAAGKTPEHVAKLEAASTEMEKFTHAIALDLQLPLRDIESCSELLAKSAGAELDQKSQSYLETISEAARRMGRLIDDLFAFSRIGQTEMYRLRLNLGDIAREVIHDLRQETEGREIEWIIGELPEVTGDSVMLWQVMTNLISNAVKFTRNRERARIEIGMKNSDGEQVFFVRDNGVGFDPQCADRLFGVFQRLHTTEFEGTGVGLANARRIIERHGGKVWAEGEAGEGAVFYFTLPESV
ncbi:MAG TPA: ATP-binding protein [Verrucomicrobiae bacterium]|jgi:PAS domain S-box-containing protein|nr:ATP-binding protein [Verrucomicrobiae bacterium]